MVDTVGTSGAPFGQTVNAQAPKHCRRWWLVCQSSGLRRGFGRNLRRRGKTSAHCDRRPRFYLIGTNVLRLYHEIVELNALYVVRLKLARCFVCVENSLIDSIPSVLSSVSAIINATHVLSVVKLSDTPCDLRASTPIAAVLCLTPQQATTSLNFAAV